MNWEKCFIFKQERKIKKQGLFNRKSGLGTKLPDWADAIKNGGVNVYARLLSFMF
jgi:hypothetical protein